VTAAIQAPFYTLPDQKTATLPVVDGVVQRDLQHDIIKVAIVDRYTGGGNLGKMFWTGLGPKTPNSAIATSVSHDLHDITVVGSSDEAMAIAVNRIIAIKGGIVLVNQGKVVAEMRLEIGGLMTCRPIADAAASMEDLYAKSDAMEWIGSPGYPTGVIFAMITCSPSPGGWSCRTRATRRGWCCFRPGRQCPPFGEAVRGITHSPPCRCVRAPRSRPTRHTGAQGGRRVPQARFLLAFVL
jgi:hypothetical protein